MNTIKPLEDLIVAVFFSKNEIIDTYNGRELSFQLDERKIPIFDSYIQRNKIGNHINFDSKTLEGRIKQSVILERMIREWTVGGVVTAIDPRRVKTSMYLLWLCLFARKTNKSVAVDTNLPEWTQRTLSYFFEEHFNATLLCKGTALYIKPFHSIVFRSIQTKRPILETAELNYLMPEKEKDELKKSMAEWGEQSGFRS